MQEEEDTIECRPSHVAPTYYERNKEKCKANAKRYYRKRKTAIKAKAKVKYKMARNKAIIKRMKKYATDAAWAERVREYNRERQRRIRAAKRQEMNGNDVDTK